jgi:hypothetical protein
VLAGVVVFHCEASSSSCVESIYTNAVWILVARQKDDGGAGPAPFFVGDVLSSRHGPNKIHMVTFQIPRC